MTILCFMLFIVLFSNYYMNFNKTTFHTRGVDDFSNVLLGHETILLHKQQQDFFSYLPLLVALAKK
jgi:hypothetical protein